jgi:TrmH family RNA methyltransferase
MTTYPRLGRDRQKRIASLRLARFRKRYGLAFTEGIRSVRAALEGGASVVEVVIADSAAPGVFDTLTLGGLPVFLVTDNEFARLSDVQTEQGILATFRLETRAFDPLEPGLNRVVLLDGVQDPGNVGTIIRTAAWYGVGAVVAGPGTADYYNPKTVRATMGSLWSTSLHAVDDLAAVVTELNDAGFQTSAAAAGASEPVARATGSAAVVFGSEAHGISRDVLERAHKVVSVFRGSESAGHVVDSLNVSVAAGIVLDRLFGQAASE